MRRGFKADSERRAVAARSAIGLGSMDPLDPWTYAEHLGVYVLEAADLDMEAQHTQQLLHIDPSSWSGMTLFEEGTHLVVLNTSDSRARRCATLMHELAHILLDHPPADVDISPSGIFLLSDYSAEHEEEADWLGATLLVPEASLLHHRRAGRSILEVAEFFGVSVDLCTWRSRMTGVEKRLALRKSP